VEYRLSESDRQLIQAATREVFLALIVTSGDLKIRISDAVNYPGHTDWIDRDQVALENVVGAFSFIVKEGKVTGLFSSSQLNRGPDWRLAEPELRSILELLPLAPDFRMF
jgi:hypothetical protein